MEFLDNAHRLKRAGRFAEALAALGQAHISGRTADVLRLELLEAVGQHRRATTLATSLLRSRQLQSADRSACEFILGKILVDEGQVVAGTGCLQRAASHGRDAKSPERIFNAQLKLMAVISEQSGPNAAAPLFADVRALATKLGDPHITAQLHLYVAETEAKRGLLDNARRHSSIARRILAITPNAYLEAFCANVELAISVLLCRFDDAQAFGELASKSAEQSGVSKIRRAVLNNMASLYCEVGQFDRATECFENALATSEINSTHSSAIFDGLARVRLLEGRLDDCACLLDRVEQLIQNDDARTLYGYRYAALTRAHLLGKQNRLVDALAQVRLVSHLASDTGDALLLSKARLTEAALLLRLRLIPDALSILHTVAPEPEYETTEVYAHLEQVVACALACEGHLMVGQVHRDRASRIYKSIGNFTGHLELERAWSGTIATSASSSQESSAVVASAEATTGASRTLHGIAAAIAHERHPGLIACELADVLLATGCAEWARVVFRSRDECKQPDSFAFSEAVVSERKTQRLIVGEENDRTVELMFEPKRDAESVASIRAIRLLLASIQELRRAGAVREHEATLWPLDDGVVDQDRAVISGQMRDVINVARRIARAKVNVLITGESGTGKEILARAIHDFSDRASKAFVPFNCTAIPRDLLESQLFGHRRGAFTGADRDQLGLIRAAKDGTLFLDEVGELGLDLQPKILRFLESGEITPLGEPGSMTIDVRIVAATNANLEDAVRAGRFREDLFYRLNVVPLSIPPLRERRDEIPGFVNHFVARAAEEFNKGQVQVAEETMERLLLYRWPGNVRQLQNEMKRMVALAEPDATLLPEAISEDILGALPIFRHPTARPGEIAIDVQGKLLATVARVETEMIKAALRKHDGKVEAVANALGISRKGLYLKRQRLGL